MTPEPRPTISLPRILLHLEGAAVLISAIVLYAMLGQPWWLFVVLFFAPDLAILPYAISPRWGRIIYNLLHQYVLPLALIVAGQVFGLPLIQALGLIWAAHIGMDRAVGYGLKYADSFKSTHLSRV